MLKMIKKYLLILSILLITENSSIKKFYQAHAKVSDSYLDDNDLYNTALPIKKNKFENQTESYEENSFTEIYQNNSQIKKPKKPVKKPKKTVNKTITTTNISSTESKNDLANLPKSSSASNSALNSTLSSNSNSVSNSSNLVTNNSAVKISGKPKSKTKTPIKSSTYKKRIISNINNQDLYTKNLNEDDQNSYRINEFSVKRKAISNKLLTEDDSEYEESPKNQRFDRSYSNSPNINTYNDKPSNNFADYNYSYEDKYLPKEIYKQNSAQSNKENFDEQNIENPTYIDKSDLYNTAIPIDYYNKTDLVDTNSNKKQYLNPDPQIKKQVLGQNLSNTKSSKNFIKVADQKPDSILKRIKKNQKAQSFTKSETKTVGNYLGVDFINTALRYEQINKMPANYDQLNYFNSISRESTEKAYKSKDGFAIKYLYAVNFNGIFFAPEIFYNHINIKHFDSKNELEDTDMTLPNIFGYRFNKIQNQYGAKLNIGYDLNSDFALYGFVGISRVRYSNLYSLYPYKEIQTVVGHYSSINNPIINYNEAFKVYNGTATAPVYGFGGKIKLSKRFYLNGEYMISDFYSKTNSKKFIKKDGELYENYGCTKPDTPQMCNRNRSDSIKLRNFLRIFKIGITFNF